jgi:protein Tex
LVCNAELLRSLDPKRYESEDVGQYTLRDILSELQKPGRDPRATFSPPKFRDDVQTLADLKLGMVLEGVVTNVTAFGAFVDVGVHQDGLVHVSQLADRFVKNPSDVVKVGDKLTVRVLEVDLSRKRIALSARKDAGQQMPSRPQGSPNTQTSKAAPPSKAGFANNPFADRFKR